MAGQGSVRIGTAERKDIFEAQKKASDAVPGPGGYDEKSTLSTKGVIIGLKREEKIEQMPGPGEYDQDASKNLQPKQGSVRIGTAPRKDIFGD